MSGPRDCRKVKKLLTLHAGGELDLRERCVVDSHLSRCLSCFRESQEQEERLGVVRAASRALPPLPEAGRFVHDVMSGVEGPPPVVAWGPRLVALSGWAAALVLGAFLWQQLPGAPTDQDSGKVQTPEDDAPPPTSPVNDDGQRLLESTLSDVVETDEDPAGDAAKPGSGNDRSPSDLALGQYVVRDV